MISQIDGVTMSFILLACVAGGIREQAIFAGGAAIFFPRAPRKFASGEAANEIQTGDLTTEYRNFQKSILN